MTHAMQSLDESSKRLVLQTLCGGDYAEGLAATLASLRCVQKASIIPVALEDAAAQQQLKNVSPVVATAKEQSLFDASFATLLIRATALPEHPAPAVRKLHNMIMDDKKRFNEKDTALGELLVFHRAYFLAPFLPSYKTQNLNSTLPHPRRSMSHEEARARENLRACCPVVSIIKEAGLDEETTFETLLLRSRQLIASQHPSTISCSLIFTGE
jgi:hypothetical protein